MKKCALFYLITVALLVGAIACSQSVTDKLAANKEVVRQFSEASNNNNYDALDNLVAANFVRHCQATPEVKIRSLAEFKQFSKVWANAFPDMKGTIDFMVAEGDLVAIYSTFTGTQKGPMGPLPASGKKMVSKTMGIFRIENGKIAELWIEWDNLAILTQLGHFPPPAKKEE